MASPLSASALVSALRAEGCRVEEYRSWRTHSRNHKGAWGPINGVMIHHTVTSGTSGSVRLCYEGYSGLPGPLCHGVIAKDGTVWLVGNGRANHAGRGDDEVLAAVIREDSTLPRVNENRVDGNARFYGFECVNLGDGDDPWPEAQLDAIERAAAAICRAYGWTANSVIGHKEWQVGKIDPRGFSMEGMRGRIARRLDNPPNQEDDMALTDDDLRRIAAAVVDKLLAGGGALEGSDLRRVADAVWNWDGIEPLEPSEDNPTNQPENVLTSIWQQLARTEAKVTAGNAAVAELAKALAARDEAVDVDALIARIEAAIERVTVRLDVAEGSN